MQDEKSTIFQMRFPQKLWYLLNTNADAIIWGGTGRTILLNYKILNHYLVCDHSVFKTTHISSFIRQLNLYGFRKVTSHLQDPLCNSSNPDMHEYIHDYFQYGRPELLNKITRKALSMKKFMMSKKSYNSVQTCSSQLEKARRALRIALRKATLNILMVKSPRNHNLPTDDSEEAIEYDYSNNSASNTERNEWLNDNMSYNISPKYPNSMFLEQDANNDTEDNGERELKSCSPMQSYTSVNRLDMSQIPQDQAEEFIKLGYFPQKSNVEDEEVIVLEVLDANSFNNDAISIKSSPKNESGTIQQDMDLEHDEEKKTEDLKMSDSTSEFPGQVEWEQMIRDIVTNKDTNSQECGTELKELYFQISKTIDLLNS